jgi:alkanesulfonate monooxygenase SsuD/methylene tetrahydromethanopterin reductase-like flavin-dependent oxidoreductase (luciferase family)
MSESVAPIPKPMPKPIPRPIPKPRPLRKLGFLTIGLFDEADPRRGHESTLEIIELGERLGFDSAWLRHRHLQYGISSPVAVLAAASQRTSRIELGTAVIPLGWENLLRLAEDLATVDLLSGGRLNPGVSVGPPMRYDTVKPALYPDTADAEDFSFERVRRLLGFVRGEAATDFSGTEGFEVFSDRVQPYSPGLGGRMWYGGGSLLSARWAGENGMNFLTSSVVKAEGPQGPQARTDGSEPGAETGTGGAGAVDSGSGGAGAVDFAGIQLSHVREFRARHPDGERARVSQGLVVIPTDSASAEQRARYEAYAAKRLPRTAAPQGPGRLVFAPDLVGTSAEIAERLRAHVAFREIDEVAFALPFAFGHEDYVQILTDIATKLGPELGWRPAG